MTVYTCPCDSWCQCKLHAERHHAGFKPWTFLLRCNTATNWATVQPLLKIFILRIVLSSPSFYVFLDYLVYMDLSHGLISMIKWSHCICLSKGLQWAHKASASKTCGDIHKIIFWNRNPLIDQPKQHMVFHFLELEICWCSELSLPIWISIWMETYWECTYLL